MALGAKGMPEEEVGTHEARKGGGFVRLTSLAHTLLRQARKSQSFAANGLPSCLFGHL